MLEKCERGVRPMDYPVLPGAPMSDAPPRGDPVERIHFLEAQLREQERQLGRQLEAARRQGIEQGRQEAAGEQGAWRRQCGEEMAVALAEFRNRRDEYLGRVEREVVRLALAIAERILHREAQMDPLLLAGAVRVALGQLAESTEVRLRVSADQHDLWVDMLRLMPGLPLRPAVLADAELHDCEAVLETSLGTVDLGVRAQIAEIERGFFDLLQVRQDANPASPSAGKQG